MINVLQRIKFYPGLNIPYKKSYTVGGRYEEPRLQHATIEMFSFAKQVCRVKGEIMFLTYHSAVECADHASSHYSTPQIESCDCRRKENARVTMKHI